MDDFATYIARQQELNLKTHDMLMQMDEFMKIQGLKVTLMFNVLSDAIQNASPGARASMLALLNQAELELGDNAMVMTAVESIRSSIG